jgi:hypothetical protein
MSIRHALPASLGSAFVLALAGMGATAPDVAAQQVFLGAGSSLYETDAYCLDSSASLTDYHAGISGDSWGASATYDDADWPWPRPPGSGPGGNTEQARGGPATVLAKQLTTPIYMTRGSSVQAVAELYPLGLLPGLREQTATLRRYLKPFIGVGVQISQDGEASSDREVPTYAVKGATDALVSYGASLRLPLQGDTFGLQVQFRATSLFSGGPDLEGPGGETISTESETVTWGTWLVGFTVGL